MRTIAIIPAGGKGVRSGNATPKQFIMVKGKELIVYTLEIFQKNELVDEIIISTETAHIKLVNDLRKKYGLSKISNVVEGGNTRQDSVYNALKSIDDAKRLGNALVCIKAKDTLVKGSKVVEKYLDRDEVYYVQTPQIFPYSVIMKAMRAAYDKNFIGTDESMLVKQIGESVNIVEGSVFDFKVTTADDIEMFEKLISTNS
jgi:2-C-methyl-D-erythritol 4-phosphate cytidylyltransferase